jgi:hypothetical protein
MKDNELDNLMRAIARDAALDDSAADEIADSPALWWGVQREIREIEPSKTPWPPSFAKRWLGIGVPVAAAILVGVLLYGISLTRTSSGEVANVPRVESRNASDTSARATAAVEPNSSTPVSVHIAEKRPTSSATRPTVSRAVVKTRTAAPGPSLNAEARPNAAAEVKTDFIALAYAREPESGQLVRVKVPSSMMVTLGIVPTVTNPSALVDAEVVVGDDGLTRSIRFIRQ